MTTLPARRRAHRLARALLAAATLWVGAAAHAQTYGLRPAHTIARDVPQSWNTCRSWVGSVPDAYTAATVDRSTFLDAARPGKATPRTASLTIDTRTGGQVVIRSGGQLEVTGATSTPASARRYDETAWLTAHNAHSTGAYNVLYDQQDGTLAEQLHGGARALMLDVYDWDNPLGPRDLYLCHGDCDIPFINPNTLPDGSAEAAVAGAAAAAAAAGGVTLGAGALPAFLLAIGVYTALDQEARMTAGTGLDEVRRFLEAHPTAVLTLILEGDASADAIQGKLQAAGLARYLYDPATDHPSGATDCWPPLEWMVEHGKRLVVFTQSSRATGPVLPQFSYTVETTYDIGIGESNYDPACKARSESAALNDLSRKLFVMNHFASFVLPTEFITITSDLDSPLDGVDFSGSGSPNDYGRILRRVETECWQAAGRYPNFIAADFFAKPDGGPGRVVAEVNRRWRPDVPGGWVAPGNLGLLAAGPNPLGDGPGLNQKPTSEALAAQSPSSAEPAQASALQQALGADVPAEFSVAGTAPNPARGRTDLMLALPGEADVQVRLYDMLGREVLRESPATLAPGHHRLPLDVSALPAGVYVWRVTAGADRAAGRLAVVQ